MWFKEIRKGIIKKKQKDEKEKLEMEKEKEKDGRWLTRFQIRDRDFKIINIKHKDKKALFIR